MSALSASPPRSFRAVKICLQIARDIVPGGENARHNINGKFRGIDLSDCFCSLPLVIRDGSSLKPTEGVIVQSNGEAEQQRVNDGLSRSRFVSKASSAIHFALKFPKSLFNFRHDHSPVPHFPTIKVAEREDSVDLSTHKGDIA